MENAIAAGLSKQIVLTRALAVSANNIANQTTPGFKAERLAFREYLAPIETGSSSARQPFGARPSGGDKTVALAFDPRSYADLGGGPVDATGGDLDFAIDGAGYFAFETAFGVRYGRDGRFGVNDFGELVNRDGARVLSDARQPILIDRRGGPVLSTPNGELQQANAVVGRLGVFQFEAPEALRRDGQTLFSNEDAAAGDPTLAASPRLRRGFVEGSNVVAVAEMTRLIEIARAYEQAAGVVATANDIARDAIERLGATT